MIIWKVSPVGLELQFFLDVDKVLHDSPYTWYVTCAFRSIAESDALYAKYQAGGPKAAPGGKSAHNIGEAVDLTLVVNGQDVWDYNSPGYHWLYGALDAHPRLHSGRAFGDEDHVESVKFRSHLVDSNGHFYLPVQNLHYLTSDPTGIQRPSGVTSSGV